MNQTKQSVFGLVLAHLRTQKFDPIERKVWSQSKLAQEAGLSLKIVGDIERGRRVRVDDESLVRLANALQLNGLEQEQFFDLAARIAPAKLNENLTVSSVLKQHLPLLKSLQTPAYVHDNLFNIIAANALWIYLWAFAPSGSRDDVLHSNMLPHFLGPGGMPRISLGPRWRNMMVRTVARFRAFSLSERHTDRYHQTLSELMSLPDFASLWMESDQFNGRQVDAGFTLVQHGRLGNGLIAPIRRPLTTRSGNLYMTVLLPGNSIAIRQFEKMIRRTDGETKLFPPYENVT